MKTNVTPAHLKGKIQGDPAAGPESGMSSICRKLKRISPSFCFENWEGYLLCSLLTPVTQVGAQGEQTGDPLGEHMQLWVEFRHLPKVEKKSEPGRKQSSMWSQSYKPPPALKPLNLSLNLTPNHQGMMMDMCHTWGKGSISLRSGYHGFIYVCHYLPAPLMCVEFGWVWVEHQGWVTVATGGAHSR